MTIQAGFLPKHTANRFKLAVTEDFFRGLKASCAHVLQENVRHIAFSDEAWRVFKEFCTHVICLRDTHDVLDVFEKYLQPLSFDNSFITGYFEPTLYGSRIQSKAFSTPLYQLPIDPKQFTRQQIREGAVHGRGLELVYVSCPVDAFFLEIQGSGRVMLDDGTILRVGYAGQNGQPYTAVGKIVKERGLLSEVNYHTLKTYLKENLPTSHEIMDQNASYVFFKEILQGAPAHHGPIGTQGISLTPMHSVAADPAFWPFGVPLFLNIPGQKIEKLALVQDTGGAIKGNSRFDYFTGFGKDAENLAGHLKDNAEVIAFWPREGG